MALSLNRLQLIGNLGRDPEVKTTPAGGKVAKLSLATKTRWTDKQGQRKERVTWHALVAWDRLADLVEQICHRGQRCFAEGELTIEQYEDGQGVARQKAVVRLQQIIALDSAKDREAGGFNGDAVRAEPISQRDEPYTADDMPF